MNKGGIVFDAKRQRDEWIAMETNLFVERGMGHFIENPRLLFEDLHAQSLRNLAEEDEVSGSLEDAIKLLRRSAKDATSQ